MFNRGFAFFSLICGINIQWDGGCFRINPYRVTPHVGFDYYYISNESFDESGDFSMARHFDRLSYNIGEVPFGVRFAKTWHRTGKWINHITPSIDLAYARSVIDNAPSTTVRFLGSPTTNWHASGSHMGRDIFRMNLDLAVRFWKSWDANLGYDLESRENYVSQQLMLQSFSGGDGAVIGFQKSGCRRG